MIERSINFLDRYLFSASGCDRRKKSRFVIFIGNQMISSSDENLYKQNTEEREERKAIEKRGTTRDYAEWYYARSNARRFNFLRLYSNPTGNFE